MQSRRTRALASGSVQGLWQAVLSGQRAERWVAPIGADGGAASAGDRGWRRLCALRNEFARRRELPSLAIVLKVVEGVSLPAPEEMTLFAAGLAAIAEIVRRGRRR